MTQELYKEMLFCEQIPGHIEYLAGEGETTNQFELVRWLLQSANVLEGIFKMQFNRDLCVRNPREFYPRIAREYLERCALYKTS